MQAETERQTELETEGSIRETEKDTDKETEIEIETERRKKQEKKETGTIRYKARRGERYRQEKVGSDRESQSQTDTDMRLRSTDAGGLRSGEARAGPEKGRVYTQDTPCRFPGVGGQCLISEEPAEEGDQREELRTHSQRSERGWM